MRFGFFFITALLSFKVLAMEDLTSLEARLLEGNQGLQALKHEISSKEHLARASFANYYPTLEAVGGWGEDRLDSPKDSDRGYFGYLNGRINLFRGLRDLTTTDKNLLEVQIAQVEFERNRRELKQQLIEITSEMIYLHKLQDILLDEEKTTRDQRKMAAKKVASGLTSQVDNLEFDLREQEIEIQRRQIDQLHKESHQKLVQLFGADIADSELDKLTFSNLESLTSSQKIDLNNTLDLQRARLQQQLSELEKQQIRSDYYPSLDFTYSLGRITPSQENPSKLDESRYAIQLTIPLFSGYDTVYKTRASTASVEAKKSLTEQAARNSASEYNILCQKMLELRDLYKINERRLGTAQKYFTMTVSEYGRGIKNSPDLVGATERWFSAQKRKYELLKELELTKVKVEKYWPLR